MPELSGKKWIFWYRLLFLIVLLLCTIDLTACVVSNKTIVFETFLIHAVQQNKSYVLARIMKAITFLGSEYAVVPVIIITGLWLLKRRSYNSLEEFLLLSLISFITEVSVKELVHRTRPISWLGITASGYSFPSGHSIMTFVIIVELVIILRRLHLARLWMYTVAFIIVLSVGISRVYLGVHWPSDVFGGWLIGSVIITAYSLLSMDHRLDGLHGKTHYIGR
jgi:undecaprenyl-diphosphatase